MIFVWVALVAVTFVALAPAQDRRKDKPQQGSESGVIAKKWNFVLMREVRLTRPSGWNYMIPWLLSTPAIGDMGNDASLEVVTGTEEGAHDFHPLGEGVGRYVCLDDDGSFLWQYNTDNNAGRASAGIADVNNDGVAEAFGGSTSGWMLHLMNGRGKRLWRFACPMAQNFLAAPAAADLDGQPGLEVVGVTLGGTVYCVSPGGEQLWTFGTGAANMRYQDSGVSGPAISDVTDDGVPDVVIILTPVNKANANDKRNRRVFGRPRLYCLNGRTGAEQWSREFDLVAEANCNFQCPQFSSPAIVPLLDG